MSSVSCSGRLRCQKKRTVIAGLAIVWASDWWLSKAGFKHARVRRSVISIQGKDLLWKSAASGGATAAVSFATNRIDYVALDCIEVRLGAFDNRVGEVWRGLLVLDDGEGYALFDEPDITTAMQRAQEAAKTFRTHLRVPDSLGESSLATDQKFNRVLFLLDRDKTISTRSVGARVRIDKRVGWASAPRYFARVLKEAGFPLFLLCVYFMLMRLGGLLSAFLHPYLGLPAESVIIDVSPAAIVGFFVPDMDVVRLAEFSLALAFVGYKAWRFSRPLMVHVDESVLLARVGKKELGRLPIDNISDFLLIEEPTLKLLVVDEKRRVIELNNFETAFEVKHVMARLTDAVFAAQRRQKLATDKHAA